MDNVGNISSLKSMAATLSQAGLKMNDKTLAAYIDHLCDAFAFYRVRRFDVAGKKYLSTGDKYYLADHSFRYAKLGTRRLDFGRIYENMVAIELMRRGWGGIRRRSLTRKRLTSWPPSRDSASISR